MITLVTLLITAMGTTVTSSSVRPLCPRGHYLKPQQSGEETCLPCPESSYMDEPSRYESCKTRRVCKPSEIVVDKGDTTRNKICTCSERARVYYDYTDQYGYDCRRCTTGLVPRPVVNRNGTGDVACCREHQVARRNDLGQVSCHDTPVYVVPGRVRTSDSSICNDTLSQKEVATVLWPYALGFSAAGLLVGIALTVIVIVVYRRKCSSGYSLTSNSMDTLNT